MGVRICSLGRTAVFRKNPRSPLPRAWTFNFNKRIGILTFQQKKEQTMGLLLPRIGVTSCNRAESLLRNHSSNIVGTFWVMNGYGFNEPDTPSWWIDTVLEENQAQAILDAYERGYFSGEHDNPLYLGFCIIVTADKNNPANFSYVIQHLRMEEFEGIGLMRILAEHNIPAHTEITYPMSFLRHRYGYNKNTTPVSLRNLNGWSVQLWEDYCSDLMAVHGQSMTASYWSK